ncbi:MAG: hypothetical protein V1809_07145 [Planctomycetota bacterium]
MNLPEPFGAVAVRLGFVTPEQVLVALKEQRRRDEGGGRHVLIGLIMVKMGFLTNGQLIEVLRHYERQRFHDSLAGPVSQN